MCRAGQAANYLRGCLRPARIRDPLTLEVHRVLVQQVEISKLLAEEGKTDVNIRMVVDEKILEFKLKNSRNLDRKSLNLLRKREISSTIN